MKGGETGMMSIDGVATHDSRRDLTQIFREGEMTELLRMRDETIVDYMHQIDELAFSIAGEVNRLHATGTGLNSSVDMMKSTFGLRHQAMNEPMRLKSRLALTPSRISSVGSTSPSMTPNC